MDWYIWFKHRISGCGTPYSGKESGTIECYSALEFEKNGKLDIFCLKIYLYFFLNLIDERGKNMIREHYIQLRYHLTFSQNEKNESMDHRIIYF